MLHCLSSSGKSQSGVRGTGRLALGRLLSRVVLLLGETGPIWTVRGVREFMIETFLRSYLSFYSGRRQHRRDCIDTNSTIPPIASCVWNKNRLFLARTYLYLHQTLNLKIISGFDSSLPVSSEGLPVKLTWALGNNSFIWEFARLILCIICTFIIDSFSGFSVRLYLGRFHCWCRPWNPGLNMNRRDLCLSISMEHKYDRENQRTSLHAHNIQRAEKAFVPCMSDKPVFRGHWVSQTQSFISDDLR